MNEAQGQAAAIIAVAEATAEGMSKVGHAVASQGRLEAVQLRVAEQYVKEFEDPDEEERREEAPVLEGDCRRCHPEGFQHATPDHPSISSV